MVAAVEHELLVFGRGVDHVVTVYNKQLLFFPERAPRGGTGVGWA